MFDNKSAGCNLKNENKIKVRLKNREEKYSLVFYFELNIFGYNGEIYKK